MTQKKQSSQSRPVLTNEELERLTANEFLRLKLTEEEGNRLREINRVRELERKERTASLKAEGEPILTDLRAVGCTVESVWDLVNTRDRYPEAIPVLIKHLLRPYSDRNREGIARALAVEAPEVQMAWPLLIDEYRKAPTGWGIIAPGDTREFRLGAKEGLAVALSVAVTEETLPELIELAKDRTQGESRVLLLSALKKRRKSNSSVAETIEELASDPDLEREIASWRRK